MSNILMAPPTEQRGNFVRATELAAGMLNITREQLLQNYKVYDDMLQLPIQLTPNQNTYTVDPTKAVETPQPLENKIDKNDWFCITGVGLRFSKADFASGVYSNQGNYDAHTFPYASVFSGAAASPNKSEADALLTIVRGMMALFVNNDQQWALPCSELVYADQNFSAGLPVYGSSNGKRGIFNLSALVLISGGVDNKIQLNLGVGNKGLIDGSAAGSTTRNYVIPVLEGIRIKNTAAGRYNGDACKA